MKKPRIQNLSLRRHCSFNSNVYIKENMENEMLQIRGRSAEFKTWVLPSYWIYHDNAFSNYVYNKENMEYYRLWYRLVVEISDSKPKSLRRHYSFKHTTMTIPSIIMFVIRKTWKGKCYRLVVEVSHWKPKRRKSLEDIGSSSRLS